METKSNEVDEKKLKTADEYITINYDDGEDTDEIEVLKPYLIEEVIENSLDAAISNFIKYACQNGDTRTEDEKLQDIIPENELYYKPIKEICETEE